MAVGGTSETLNGEALWGLGRAVRDIDSHHEPALWLFKCDGQCVLGEWGWHCRLLVPSVLDDTRICWVSLLLGVFPPLLLPPSSTSYSLGLLLIPFLDSGWSHLGSFRNGWWLSQPGQGELLPLWFFTELEWIQRSDQEDAGLLLWIQNASVRKEGGGERGQLKHSNQKGMRRDFRLIPQKRTGTALWKKPESWSRTDLGLNLF